MADRQIPEDVLQALQAGARPRGTEEFGDLSYLDLSGALDEVEAGQGIEKYLPSEMPEPPAVERGGSYSDESGKLLILKEFTLGEFKPWFLAQHIGAAPYNGVGLHHTYIPTSQQYRGTPTLEGVFRYYRDERGWPWGVGPHLWLIDGSGAYRHGTPLVAVGTHPRHDGIGISYRNHRWLHIEALHNGDASPFSSEMMALCRSVLRIVCGRRGQRVNVTPGPAVDGPTSWQGVLFHRDARTNIKSCPGTKVTHQRMDDYLEAPEQEREEPGGDEPGRQQPAPPTGPAITWRRGTLVAVPGAIARSRPSRKGEIVQQLEEGRAYAVDGHTDEGERIEGSSRWYHLTKESGYGWCHSSGGDYRE